MLQTILVVDDEKSVRESLKLVLSDSYRILIAASGEEAIETLLREKIDLMLLDIRMPGISGMDVLKQIENIAKDLEVIIITADTKIDTAIGALSLGAYHYITKPFNSKDLLAMVHRVLEKKSLVKENISLRSKITQATSLGEIIGQAEEMQKAILEINRAIRNDDTVVLFGEPGTEKGLVAYTIHQQSVRSNGAFVTIQCAQRSAYELERELFGEEQTSTKGLLRKRMGAFEEADGGVLFLNELGILPSSLQEKLLQAIQTRKFKRINGQHELALNVRLICGSTLSLRRLVTQGHFNEELFHYINVLPIDIPPLRQRKKDIPLLIDSMIQRFNRELGFNVEGISEESLLVLTAYDWPGNVTELENTIEQMILQARTGQIEVRQIPLAIVCAGEQFLTSKDQFSLQNIIKTFHTDHIHKILTENQGNIMLTALQLKVESAQIEKAIKK